MSFLLSVYQTDHISEGIGFGVEQGEGGLVGLVLIGDHDGKAACPVS